MAAGATYTPIASFTVSTATPTVTFSSISGAYTDLIFIGSFTAAAATQTVNMQVNGSTTTIYSFTYLTGNGSVAASARSSADDRFAAGWTGTSTTNMENNYVCNLMNYSNTTTYKTFLSQASAVTRFASAQVGLWRSTAAITSISVTPGGNNWVVGSSFAIYGIAAA